MRFLHTADWQLGMRASHVGAAGERVRQERLLAAQRTVKIARDQGAEFLLVAGDTFESNAVDRLLIQKVADILGGFGKPVYVIPGNHDPLTPGSVWEHPAWKAYPQVILLREAVPVELPGGWLYPCPLHEKYSSADPTAWIPAEGEAGIRIGLAHGTVEGIPQDAPDYPIPRDVPARAKLDFLALGHWHSLATYSTADGATRMAYSGTHETTKFGERDSGNALLVDIEGPGSIPKLTPVRTGGLTWSVVQRDLRDPGDLERLRSELETRLDPADTLIDLRLEGVLPAAERDELARIQEILEARYLFARVDRSRVSCSPQDENWVAGLPPGVLREVAERLRQFADPAFTGERPQGATSEVACRALIELYALL